MSIRNELAAKLVLVGFVVLFVIFFSRSQTTKSPKLGEEVPNFTLNTEDGRPVSLSDYRGKIVVLNFWASWCGPCIDELPSLNRFAERYASKGVEVLGVSLDEDPEKYSEFLQKYRVGFTTVRNINRIVSEQYGTYKLPETFIVGRDGRLLHKVIGAVDWTTPQMTSYFDGLVNGS